MEEKIIIDGVCINNCQYCKIIPYDYPTSGIDIECYIDYQNEITKDCKENPNCLYKQLKRLEQENEELKKYKNLFLKMKKFHFDERINNEKILKENEDLKDSIKRFTCQSECLRYKQYQQAKKALEEIKKLTIIGINASQCNCGLRALADDILHIITEAIGE